MAERRTRTVEEITNPLLSALTRVLPSGPGVCRICHGAPRGDYIDCASCHRTVSEVSAPIRLVAPISLYEIPSQLHTILWGYKNTVDDVVRRRQLVQVAAIVGRFLHHHGQCIGGAAGSSFETMTFVPSTRARAGAHPLEQAIGLLPSLAPRCVPLLEPGVVSIDEERRASDQAFEPLPSADGRRVLLIDDTFTTGARVQSAASALQRGGARVVAAVVVGRVVRPDFSSESATLWERTRAQAFSFDVCCFEGQAQTG